MASDRGEAPDAQGREAYAKQPPAAARPTAAVPTSDPRQPSPQPADETAVERVGPALLEEATRKAGLVWLDYEGTGAPRPAWHVWREGAAYVVTGAGEQHLPGLAEATAVTVIVPSKDSRARLVTWRGEASVVTSADDDWEPAVVALAAGRLNAPESTTLVQRWAAEATVVRLRPTGEVAEAPGRQPDGSHARAPRETLATTLGRQPWMVGARRRATDRSAH